MIKFLTLKPKAFGLDFSDLSLKITNLKKKGRFFSLASWGETEIEPGIIKQGEIMNQEVLSDIIKNSLTKLKGEKLKIKNVVASLPEKHAFLQIIKMPKMDKRELSTAVPFEAENYIPFPIEEVYLDFEVVPPLNGYSNKSIDVLIAAIPKKIVDPYVYCLKKAGLLIQALEIESQSISRALIKNQITPSPVLLIDFGKSNTNLIIFSCRSLFFTSSIFISSFDLTEAISRSLNIGLAEAEKLKLKHGLNSQLKRKKTNSKKKKTSSQISNDINAAMTPVLTSLVKKIKKYLDYYKSHASNYSSSGCQGVEEIILSGRGSNLIGLDDFLYSQLGIPVKLGNPWINILPSPLKQVPKMPFKESLGYTTALGLALRSIKGEEISE
jgi:type IV pilus assembly protein PilM